MEKVKLIKILNLTTSDADGECLNAIRRVVKYLKESNLTWDNVLAGFVPDRVRFVKIINYTTSDNDNECLVAIRKVNKLLKLGNVSWDSLITIGGSKSYGKPYSPANPFKDFTYDEDILREAAENLRKAANSFADEAFWNFFSGQAKAANNRYKPNTPTEEAKAEKGNFTEHDTGSDELTFFNMDDEELLDFLKCKEKSKDQYQALKAYQLRNKYYKQERSFYHADKVLMLHIWKKP